MKWWAHPSREIVSDSQAILFYCGSMPVRVLISELQRRDSQAI